MRGRKQSKKQKNVLPKTAEQLFSKSEQFQNTWNAVVHVVGKMRASGKSLRETSREMEVDPRTVTRLAGSALRKNKSGRYSAKASDRLLRVLVIPTKEGLQEVAVRDSRVASHIAGHSDAVQKYLQTGDASGLRKIGRRKLRDAQGKPIKLLSNVDDLNRLGSAGVLSFESLYARSV